MSSVNDLWGGPSWAFQTKADATYDLLEGATLDTSGNLTLVGALDVQGITNDLTLTQTGVATFAVEPIVAIDQAGTNAVVDAMTLRVTSTGTPAAGLGVALVFETENDAPATHEAGRIEVDWATETAASEDSDMRFDVYDGGSKVTPLAIIGATPSVLVTGNLDVTGDITLTDGGTVTQTTNISTGVTLNTHSGQITCVTNPSIAAAAEATFTVTNSVVNTLDTIIVNVATQPSDGFILPWVSAIGSGSFNISLTNVDAAAVSAGTPVINFTVLGGAAS
jgi:hypothetical protein